MSELPPGWTSATVAELIAPDGIFSDGDWVESKDQDPKGAIRLLQLADVGDGVFVDKSNRFVNDDKFERLRCTEVFEGDVLIARMPDPLGRACLAPKLRQPCITVVDVAIVRPGRTSVSPRWLMHFLNAPAVRQVIELQASGTTRRRISRGNLAQLDLPVPPLPEQKRIADKLDALLSQVNACRERLGRIPGILKRFRQSVLAAATSGELTREWRESNRAMVDSRPLAQAIAEAHAAAGGHKAGNAAPPTDGVHDLSVGMFPQGWSLLTLRDIVEPARPITYGILKPGPELDEGVPYVRVADFPNDRLNLRTIRKTSPAMDEEFKRSRLRCGDVLLSIRGTVGRLVVVPPELENANITQDTARLSIQPEVNAAFVLWVLRSELVQQRMKGAVKGVAVRGINIGDVRALQVPLPSRAEQDEIVRRIENLLSQRDQMAANVEQSRKRVNRLTPALLTKGFRGELVPQDPDDEPASALLARVAAQRNVTEDTTSPGKPRRARPPRAPKEAATMTKSRQDDDVMGQPYLAGHLRRIGTPTSAEALFKVAELPVADFYKQLAWEVAQGHVKDNQTTLESGHASG